MVRSKVSRTARYLAVETDSHVKRKAVTYEPQLGDLLDSFAEPEESQEPPLENQRNQ